MSPPTRAISAASPEDRDDRFRALDAMPSLPALTLMFEAHMQSLQRLHDSLPMLANAADAAAARLASSDQSRLVYAGAGTSARLAVQDGIELLPTFRWPSARVAHVLAGGEAALLQAVEGAEDDVDDARKQISTLHLQAGDVCIAVAASGNTPFTVAAAQAARSLGALTIGIANRPQSLLLQAVEHPLLAATGAVVVSGSTRLAAGTAQKVLLNLLSTRIMMLLGHVYDGMMVDVLATNEKLRQRSVRMLMTLTTCSEADAHHYLAQSQGHVKLAVLLAHGASVPQAQALLHEHAGHLRAALQALAG